MRHKKHNCLKSDKHSYIKLMLIVFAILLATAFSYASDCYSSDENPKWKNPDFSFVDAYSSCPRLISNNFFVDLALQKAENDPSILNTNPEFTSKLLSKISPGTNIIESSGHARIISFSREGSIIVQGTSAEQYITKFNLNDLQNTKIYPNGCIKSNLGFICGSEITKLQGNSYTVSGGKLNLDNNQDSTDIITFNAEITYNRKQYLPAADEPLRIVLKDNYIDIQGSFYEYDNNKKSAFFSGRARIYNNNDIILFRQTELMVFADDKPSYLITPTQDTLISSSCDSHDDISCISTSDNKLLINLKDNNKLSITMFKDSFGLIVINPIKDNSKLEINYLNKLTIYADKEKLYSQGDLSLFRPSLVFEKFNDDKKISQLYIWNGKIQYNKISVNTGLLFHLLSKDDIDIILEKNKFGNYKESIIDLLKSLGQDSSFSNRKALYESFFHEEYKKTKTESQNIRMINAIMNGELKLALPKNHRLLELISKGNIDKNENTRTRSVKIKEYPEPRLFAISKDDKSVVNKAEIISNHLIKISRISKKDKPKIEKEVKKHSPIIDYYCKKRNLPSNLVYSLIAHESLFINYKSSDEGSYGLMQVNINAHKEYTKQDMADPRKNIGAGTKILSKAFTYADHLIKKYNLPNDPKTRMTFALAVYNAGYGNVEKFIKNKNWKGNPEKIPFSTTRSYVKNILKLYNSLQ